MTCQLTSYRPSLTQHTAVEIPPCSKVWSTQAACSMSYLELTQYSPHFRRFNLEHFWTTANFSSARLTSTGNFIYSLSPRKPINVRYVILGWLHKKVRSLITRLKTEKTIVGRILYLVGETFLLLQTTLTSFLWITKTSEMPLRAQQIKVFFFFVFL